MGVLASGRGSNLQALIDAGQKADFPAEVVLVLSDKKNSYALERASMVGIRSIHLSPKEDDFYRKLGDEIENFETDLICCAGFIRILPPEFVSRFSGRIINIHPSLLPSFPGLHAQKKALDAGVTVTGCTVHFVDEGVDTGPIILQAAVPVLPYDDEETLSERILVYEHRIYPLAVRLIAEGSVHCVDGVVLYSGNVHQGSSGFISPVTE
ncbi:MAG: phosphoribosylglycinamide formyltransferase [Nitrospinae bacterium]|nr:phosphoribosylglycinamide formyltransferase [Nitrospinota bacterium]